MNHCEDHHFGLIAKDYNSQTSWVLITEQKGQKTFLQNVIILKGRWVSTSFLIKSVRL